MLVCAVGLLGYLSAILVRSKSLITHSELSFPEAHALEISWDLFAAMIATAILLSFSIYSYPGTFFKAWTSKKDASTQMRSGRQGTNGPPSKKKEEEEPSRLSEDKVDKIVEELSTTFELPKEATF